MGLPPRDDEGYITVAGVRITGSTVFSLIVLAFALVWYFAGQLTLENQLAEVRQRVEEIGNSIKDYNVFEEKVTDLRNDLTRISQTDDIRQVDVQNRLRNLEAQSVEIETIEKSQSQDLQILLKQLYGIGGERSDGH